MGKAFYTYYEPGRKQNYRLSGEKGSEESESTELWLCGRVRGPVSGLRAHCQQRRAYVEEGA